MKPNKRQIEICNFCKEIINTWINTNDINSPTHFGDIIEFINTNIADDDNIFESMLNDYLANILHNLLSIIRKYK